MHLANWCDIAHLAATAKLVGTRELTTENLLESPSVETEPAAFDNGSWMTLWWTTDVCRLDRPGIDDVSLGNSTPRRRVVSWPLYRYRDNQEKEKERERKMRQ